MKEKFLHFGTRLIRHELVSGSVYIFLGFLLASFLGFLVNLFLARNLSSSDYGIYASLLSLFTLASIPTQSIIPIVVRFATDFFAKSELDKASNFYFKVFRFVFVLSLLIFLAFITLSTPIENFLHLDNFWYVFLTGLSVSFSYLAIINVAFLQSLLKFSFVGFSYILNGAARLAITVVLVYLGFKVFGALIAIIFAILAPFLFQFIPLRFLFKQKRKIETKISGKEIIDYALPTTITTLSLMSLTSTDVILVKHFFSAETAGLYGGLSLIGKVIFYFTGPIPSVMFPLLIRRHNLGQNFHSLFYLALILVIVPSIAITIIYFIFPQFIVSLFLGGGSYLKIASLLGLFGIFLTIFSLINVFVNFFLSLKKTNIYLFVLFAAISQIVLINFFHSSFTQVIFDSLFVSLGLLIILFIFYIINYKNLVKTREKFTISPGLN